MSDKEREFLIKGLEKAEYNMLCEKSKRNEMILQDDENGEVIRVPAREVFVKLYNKPYPTY